MLFSSTLTTSPVTGTVILHADCSHYSYNVCFFVSLTGSSIDGADLKLTFAALTTVLLEAAKLDKDELSLRYVLH